jgi:hypothetical protein
LVKEKSKIPILISYDEGINKYSGLIDIALDLGFVVKPSMGWYSRVNKETGEIEEKKFRIKDTNTKDFWDQILNSETFKNAVYERYAISSNSIISDDVIEEVFTAEEEYE